MCFMVSDKATRTRISLTLTKVYVETLDQLVDEGFYLERQVAIRAALRLLFKFHGIEPFADKGAELETEKVDQ